MMKSDPILASERLRRFWEENRGAVPRTAAVGLSVLVGIVAVVWLLRPGPQTSGAQGLTTKVLEDSHQDRLRSVRPKKDLPLVPGRHDRIHRDFFRLSMDAAPPMEIEENTTTEEKTGDFPDLPSQEVLNPTLQLKAIMVGTRPRALINDVIISVGEKVKLIADAPNDDVFEVTAIDDQTVTLNRGGKVIVLCLEPEEEGSAEETGMSQ
jgi:hypothetical protein